MDEDKKYYCMNCHTLQEYSHSNRCVICENQCELITLDEEKISHKKLDTFLWTSTLILCVLIILFVIILPFLRLNNQINFDSSLLAKIFLILIFLIFLLLIICYELILRGIIKRTNQEIDKKIDELESLESKKEDNDQYQKDYQ